MDQRCRIVFPASADAVKSASAEDAKILENKEPGQKFTREQKFSGVTDDSRLTLIRDQNHFIPSDWTSVINNRDPKISFQRTVADSARKKETVRKKDFSNSSHTNTQFTLVNE